MRLEAGLRYTVTSGPHRGHLDRTQRDRQMFGFDVKKTTTGNKKPSNIAVNRHMALSGYGSRLREYDNRCLRPSGTLKMEVERRALTTNEFQQIVGNGCVTTNWLSLIGRGIGNGAGLVGLLLITGLPFALIASYFELGEQYGGAVTIYLYIVYGVGALVAIYFIVYLINHELKHRRNYEQFRLKLSNSDDLIVEQHRIIKCLFVREPKHGQPMYFVQSEDDVIFFILEGQAELDLDWEQDPQRLKDDEKPRAQLKLIREPSSKQCLFEEFNGQTIPPGECHIIPLSPSQWPTSGNKIKGPWETLAARYRLKVFHPKTQ